VSQALAPVRRADGAAGDRALAAQTQSSASASAPRTALVAELAGGGAQASARPSAAERRLAAASLAASPFVARRWQALVTTADHPTHRQIVAHFTREALARQAVSWPRGRRTGYRRRFQTVRAPSSARGSPSRANLFLVRSPGAVKVANFWMRLEGVRKQPWRWYRTLVPQFCYDSSAWLTFDGKAEVSRQWAPW
jgi:hypothetical protein